MVRVENIVFANGIWRGLATFSKTSPRDAQIYVTFHGDRIDGVTIDAGPSKSEKIIEFPIPSAAIGDGVHTLLIMVDGLPDPVSRVTLSGGHALAHDLTAEVAQLREELDIIKRVIRQGFAAS